MTRMSIAVAAVTLLTFATTSNARAALTDDGFAAAITSTPTQGAIEIAANNIYLLRNATSSDVWVKILGTGPGFPAVVLVPVGVGLPVPIPYPEINIQVRKNNGAWSSVKKLKWKPGPIKLPSF